MGSIKTSNEMTPKEKAEELYCKYDSLFKAPFKKHQDLKQCALIAVDEIINSIVIFDLTAAENQFTYWEQVKQEIEKL
jgi:mRNA-degrading endonuclease HigB of HigAB toxin-antitoxin module